MLSKVLESIFNRIEPRPDELAEVARLQQFLTNVLLLSPLVQGLRWQGPHARSVPIRRGDALDALVILRGAESLWSPAKALAYTQSALEAYVAMWSQNYELMATPSSISVKIRGTGAMLQYLVRFSYFGLASSQRLGLLPRI